MNTTDPTLATPADVRAWFDALFADGVNFHPEDSFSGIVHYDTHEPTYTDTEARRMDAAMTRAYDLVPDPCAIANDAFDAHQQQQQEAPR